MKLYLPYIILFINLLSSRTAYAAADSIYHTIHFNTENGLPSNRVYSCVQDRYGYMWFATENGAVKYNGYSFKVFTTKDGLPSNDVWRLYADSYGRVWLGAHGYSIGYIRNDVYKNVINTTKTISIDDIGEIGGNIIVNANELFVIDKNDNVMAVPGFAYCRNHLIFPNIGFDKRIYLYTAGSNLHIFSPHKKGLSVQDVKGYNTDSLYLLAHYYWLFNKMKGLSISWDKKKLNFYDVKRNSLRSVDIKVPGSHLDEEIYMVYFFNGGSEFYVLGKEHIYMFSAGGELNNVQPINDIIPVKAQVSFLFIDSFKHSWYTTQKSGVWMKIHDTGFLVKDARLSVLENMKKVGTLQNGDTYWWGADRHLLMGMDRNLGVIHKEIFPGELLSVSSKSVDTLYLNFADGLYLFDTENRIRFDYFSQYKNKKHTAYVIDSARAGNRRDDISDLMFKRYSSNIISSHHYSDDIMYVRVRIGIMRHRLLNDTLFIGSKLGYDERVDKMYYDSLLKRFWMINKGTIGLLNPVADSFLLATPDVFRILGMNNIEDFTFDKNGNIFILSADKILLFNYRNLQSKIIRLNADASKAKMCVTGDQLYLCGYFGILNMRVGPDGNVSSLRIVPNPHNLFYSSIEELIVLDTASIIMQTDRGLFMLDTRKFKELAKPVNKICFQKRVLFYQNFIKDIHDNDTFYIPNNATAVNLDVINFQGAGKPIYNYSIDNGEWLTSTSGEIQVPATPGQLHTVTYVVSDDVWRSNRYTFYVMQIPHWWQTTLWKRIFWIGGGLMLIILGIVIALITRYYVRKSNEKKQALTDMELRALYAQINPHFIFNTLGTAQFFINRQKMDEAYNHVNKFSRLLRAYLKASGNRYVNLGEEIALLKDYIELQQIRFEQKFEYTIEIDNKIAKDSMMVPTLLLQPLVENAINHGLFHLGEGEKGLLQIKFQQGKNSEELVCIIEDNGVGRERSKAIKKDSTIEKDASYGTTLTKKLIDIFKEYEKMNIYLEYIDKQEPETGTIVKLTIGNVKYEA